MTDETEQTTTERARALIANHLCVEPRDATDDADLAEDLDADSLDCVEVTMALEDEFRVEITDDEAEAVKTVGDWLRLVEAKVGARTAA